MQILEACDLIGCPPIRVITSPAWKPAAAAGEPGEHGDDAGRRDRLADGREQTANRAIASTKLAAGPAATISARCQSGLKWK